MQKLRSRGFVILMVGAGVLAGCTKKSDTATSDSTVSTRTDTVQQPVSTTTTDTTHAAAPAQLTDGNILALLSEGDSSEVVEAKAMLAKTKSADVKGFANLMVADHGKLKKEGEALAKKINVTPQPPANDPTPAELTSALSMINSSTDTHALDSEYIAHAVDDHTKDLANLQDWKSKAQNADLKTAIDQAMPIVQKHLDKAKAIADKMAKMPAPKAGKK